MSQSSTDGSFILYHSPLLACKKIKGNDMNRCSSGDELRGFSTKMQAEKLQNRQNKPNPASVETFSPKSLAAGITAVKVCLPFSLGVEGSFSLPLCSRSSVLNDTRYRYAPGQRIKSRRAILRLSETCMGEDPSSWNTSRSTERPRVAQK